MRNKIIRTEGNKEGHGTHYYSWKDYYLCSKCKTEYSIEHDKCDKPGFRYHDTYENKCSCGKMESKNIFQKLLTNK